MCVALTPHSDGDVVGERRQVVALGLALEDGLVIGTGHCEGEDAASRDSTEFRTQRLLQVFAHVPPVPLPRDAGQGLLALEVHVRVTCNDCFLRPSTKVYIVWDTTKDYNFKPLQN
ncbi:hypothetical protein CEXT_760921 [Caerostris extrusa]|uniref:Uncharacterized protein n=1 Tax=Caerostris extrusa TaxID=172846 RepID=A0AAV4WUR4_CAEEX|nr:hypothetical protein CEXT_760921 [Caerostris extrusa]